MFDFRCHARLCAALIASVSLSEGAIIYSNFPATEPGYTPNSVYEVKVGEFPSAPGFPPLLIKEHRGMAFVAPGDAVVERIYLPLMFRSGSIRISLMSAAADGFPGTVLDSVVLTSAPDSDFQFYTGQFANAPTILTGQSYWVTAGIETERGDVLWPGAFPFHLGPVAFRQAPGVFGWTGSLSNPFAQAAFRLEGQILGAPVPEPTSSVLTCLGVSAMLAARKLTRRKSPASGR